MVDIEQGEKERGKTQSTRDLTKRRVLEQKNFAKEMK